ncbi:MULTISPECIES: Na/Pi cotransporter family protein [Pseudochrobactrum]|uniref:Phosphate:Na+ symporter n=1 Tax=Pseudochrobactrum saccharolyticum TaxID=354352 RepID=A0A7W8AKB8_9HYPH|nr:MULTISPECIES: Na/Pi cotransporter family protein [Pseudochrobactrum]MBX8784244.1 Na/Pi cotransporter family protein [Ochrobactrum sp. GRS2]MBX8811623.1 Na/Pi cotransporter family protein [Ochrobactrum sp. MR34]KAB0537654.1 Na/Pi cotransporter family protein [Pseudochrobactrum saccharolyticum]MBB5091971.1 phosphate:Na+ symporter [Pseudochrobactrum saccharolyticum]MDP8250191.1 Na/Pi cotransporter family protein [Pseudochrobactrum saccharolyticum]
MNGSVVLLHLAGAVALLLWATRMVRAGVESAYGDRLRRRLRKYMQKPLLAVSFGVLLAVSLQSSTAVTLLVGSFVGAGFVSGVAGLMAVRGGELGSALVVKILSYDLTLLVPLALVAGTFISMSSERLFWRQNGKILVGIGLLILSLELTGEATTPLRDSQLLPVIVNYLASDPVTTYLLAALMTWLFHSSIAAIILLTSFASRGLIQPDLAVVMVLGVNLGSSIIAPLLTRNAPPETRVVPLGNLLMRGAGSLVILILFLSFKPPVEFLGSDPVSQVVNAHILFNTIILIAGIPLSGLVLRATEALVNLKAKPEAPAETVFTQEISALDMSVINSPPLALGNATREVVRTCETVDVMLRRIMDLYEKPDQVGINELAKLDDRLDARHAAIKLYLAKLATKNLSEDEALRTQELLGACVKLEQVGDIIVRNMLAHVQKKMDRKLEFTEEGWDELTEFHAMVVSNAHLAFNVLVSRDSYTARQLVHEKDHLRDMEKRTSEMHFQRLREGTVRSVETSSIHLDTIRDLKQINSLLASMAYPVLEEKGMLGGTRLKTVTES